ncbi:MAG: TetR family transcriptional regulator [Acidimicrobiales bacterium]
MHRGRPRSNDRTETILVVAAELLREGGYDNLHMQDVAERARSGSGHHLPPMAREAR